MINKIKEIGLNNWILISMILGFLVGIVINLFAVTPFVKDILIDNIFYFGGTGFINLMKMLVVPLIFCSIVVGTASLSNSRKIGSISIEIILFYIITTLIAVCLAIFIGSIIQPGNGLNMVGSQFTSNITSNVTLTDNLLNMIPSNPIGSMANGEIIPTIIFAIIVGLVLSMLQDETRLVKDFFTQANKVMIKMTSLVMNLAPIGVFCLMASTFANLGISGLIPLFKFIISVILAIFIQMFVIYPLILFIFTRLSPIRFYKKFISVMIFAFSSTSSNATIPLTLEKLSQLGVSEEVSSFSIPLGATINMDGNAIMQGCAIMFATQAYGLDLGLSALITVIFMAVIASISAAGIPSAAIISMNMLFMSVGLPLDIIAILLGIDHFLDLFRTTINVTGDAICTIIVSFRHNVLDVNLFNGDKDSR
ncbi:MAG TPA: dicarboxylate/amino acid:cation symporter [Methanosphaera sp.]|nr:dicarboxylate/amino acid:cation symporter [Methanosphaera sp.]